MPENPVTDPVTDQEIAFAHLIMSETMTDSRAAEAVGLNPTSAACIKSRPRVRDYMLEHRAAVKNKLEEKAAGNVGRDQILARLWHLAGFNPDQTKGSISGQIKAISLIIAIEDLIPGRRLASARNHPAALPVDLQMYLSEAMRRKTEAAGPSEVVTAMEAPRATEAEPPAKSANEAPSPSRNQSHTPFNPFAYTKGVNAVLDTMERVYDVNLNPASPLKLAIPKLSAFARGR
jgi:hypothetical protein